MEKLKVESRLLDNQPFRLNSHPEGSRLQVRLTAAVCRVGVSSSFRVPAIRSELRCCADITSRERMSLSCFCVVYFLLSKLFHHPITGNATVCLFINREFQRVDGKVRLVTQRGATVSSYFIKLLNTSTQSKRKGAAVLNECRLKMKVSLS